MNDLIDREEILATQPILVEALDIPYWASGHLPGAIAMPLARIAAVADAELHDKQADIVVYCAGPTCKNSDVAAAKLRDMGYARVRVYRGGKADWKDAGLALVPEVA
jgi:rhodanese-related sulfurtransferase